MSHLPHYSFLFVLVVRYLLSLEGVSSEMDALGFGFVCLQNVLELFAVIEVAFHLLLGVAVEFSTIT